MKPRVLLVGRRRYRLPLDDMLRLKFDALGAELDLRVVGSGVGEGPSSDQMFRLVQPFRPRALDGVAFHASLPLRIARELRSFRPDAVLVQ
ncbi:MAG: hypothetical protein M3540_11775, partial [Actinomycetota bacterium]|nr:hypothetical protein [Actinomycetota bacterium]